MVKEIELPDGSIGEFPDSMSDQEIAAVLQKQFGGQEAQPDPQQPSFENILGQGSLPDTPITSEEVGDVFKQVPEKFTRGAIKGLGAPVDLLNLGLSGVNLAQQKFGRATPPIPEIPGGSQDIGQGLDFLERQRAALMSKLTGQQVQPQPGGRQPTTGAGQAVAPFAEAAGMGMLAPSRFMTSGVRAGLAGEAGAQGAGLVTDDPRIRGAAGILAGGVGGARRTVVSPALRSTTRLGRSDIRKALRDVTPEQLEQARILQERSRGRLSGPEAVGEDAPELLKLMDLAKTGGGGAQAQRFLGTRTKLLEGDITGQLNKITQTVAPRTLEAQTRAAGRGAVRRRKEARTFITREAGFREAERLDVPVGAVRSMVNEIRTLRKSVTEGSDLGVFLRDLEDSFMSRPRPDVRVPKRFAELPGTRRVPAERFGLQPRSSFVTNIKDLNDIKIRFRDRLPRFDAEDVDPRQAALAREANPVLNRITAMLERTSDRFRIAQKKFREVSEEFVDPLIGEAAKGDIGLIGKKKTNIESMMSFIVNPKKTTPQEARRLLRQLSVEDPEVVPRLLRHHLDEKFNAATKALQTGDTPLGSANFRKLVMGGTDDRKLLRTFFDATEDIQGLKRGTLWRGFQDTLEISSRSALFPRTGSATDIRRAAGAARGIRGARAAIFNPLQALSGNGAEILRKTNQDIMGIFTDPNSVRLLSEIANLPKRQRQAIILNMLRNAANREAELTGGEE